MRALGSCCGRGGGWSSGASAWLARFRRLANGYERLALARRRSRAGVGRDAGEVAELVLREIGRRLAVAAGRRGPDPGVGPLGGEGAERELRVVHAAVAGVAAVRTGAAAGRPSRAGASRPAGGPSARARHTVLATGAVQFFIADSVTTSRASQNQLWLGTTPNPIARHRSGRSSKRRTVQRVLIFSLRMSRHAATSCALLNVRRPCRSFGRLNARQGRERGRWRASRPGAAGRRHGRSRPSKSAAPSGSSGSSALSYGMSLSGSSDSGRAGSVPSDSFQYSR